GFERPWSEDRVLFDLLSAALDDNDRAVTRAVATQRFRQLLGAGYDDTSDTKQCISRHETRGFGGAAREHAIDEYTRTLRLNGGAEEDSPAKLLAGRALGGQRKQEQAEDGACDI